MGDRTVNFFGTVIGGVLGLAVLYFMFSFAFHALGGWGIALCFIIGGSLIVAWNYGAHKYDPR